MTRSDSLSLFGSLLFLFVQQPDGEISVVDTVLVMPAHLIKFPQTGEKCLKPNLHLKR